MLKGVNTEFYGGWKTTRDDPISHYNKIIIQAIVDEIE